MFVSLNTSVVQIYSCITGYSLGYSVYTGSPMKAFGLLSDGYTVVGVTTSNLMYKITTTAASTYLGNVLKLYFRFLCKL